MKRPMIVSMALLVAFLITMNLGAVVASQQKPQSATNDTLQYSVSPPKVVIDSINYLVGHPGTFSLSNSTSVVSENGVINIVNAASNWTVSVFQMSSQVSQVQSRMVFNTTLDGKATTIEIMLSSNNGYFYNVTNFLGQVTDAFKVPLTNETSSAIIIAEYPVFATARIVHQAGPDIIIGGGGGGPYTWSDFGYASWVYTGNEKEQLWENVTIWYYQNSSSVPPTFVRASVHTVAEASEYVDEIGWFSTSGYIGVSSGNYNQYGNYYVDPSNMYNSPNYVVNVGAPAGDWIFAVSYWNESTWNLIGHTLWDNASYYYPSLNIIPLEASVPVTIT